MMLCVDGRRDDVSGAAGFCRAGWRTWPSLRRNHLPKVGASMFIFVKLGKSFGLIMIRWWVSREGYASNGGGGLPVVHLSCNDGRQIATEHFAENERIFYVLTLAVSRYINTFFYPHIWGIIGRAIELAFLAFKSKLTKNDYLSY